MIKAMSSTGRDERNRSTSLRSDYRRLKPRPKFHDSVEAVSKPPKKLELMLCSDREAGAVCLNLGGKTKRLGQ